MGKVYRKYALKARPCPSLIFVSSTKQPNYARNSKYICIIYTIYYIYVYIYIYKYIYIYIYIRF